MNPRRPIDRKSGQAIIFLMVVLVIGLFAVLWNFDLHNTVSTKVRVGNAGDAGALAAARWQGITMNMIGELNLVQAAVILEDPLFCHESVGEIAELKDRLALNGPLMGYVAAQSAAFLNLWEKDETRINDDVRGDLMSRAVEFQSAGGLYYNHVSEPYQGAWQEYGSMLAAIASGDMAVSCGNTKYFVFYDGSHILLNPSFYNAIASRYWCWFSGGYRDLLVDYSDFNYWSPLPPLDTRPSINSEYFSLQLKRENISLNWGVSRLSGDESLRETFDPYIITNETIAGANWDQTDPIPWETLIYTNWSWHFYDQSAWNGSWNTSFMREDYTVKPEFNHKGADAAVDIYLQPFSITPGMQVDYDDIRWIAAAKPFGWLPVNENGSRRQKPHYFGLVLPAFHQARLIANGNSSRPQGVTAPGWDEHIYDHLPVYMNGGPESIAGNGCFYCQQLITWEDPDFRMTGDEWLQEYHENPDRRDHCEVEGGGGGGVSGGGTGDWR